MSEDLERLDDDLMELVRREAKAPDLSAARVARARERLQARLFIGVGLGATAAGAATSAMTSSPVTSPTVANAASATKTLALAKLGGVILLAFTGGMASGWMASKSTTASPTSAPLPPIAPSRVAEHEAPSAEPRRPSTGRSASAPVADVSSLPTAPAASSPSPRSSVPSPSATESGVSVDAALAERTLLDQARRALREGDGGRALDLIGRHEHDFARGSLVEEREVLWVNALVSLGRFDEAKTRTNAFRKRFPTSPFLPALDSQLRDR